MLDSNQKSIFEKIQKENGKNNVFIITGVAGSGKTTLISELSKNKGNFDEVIVSSLTGKACQVLKNKGVVDARTIQSFLYGRPRFNIKLNKKGKLKKIAIDLFEKLNTLKVDLNTPKNRLFIFDEASMIIDVITTQKNTRYANQSKSQLDEILSRINSSKGSFTILMVGDRNQLPPPVPERENKLPYSDALSKEFWKLNGFKTVHYNLEKSYRIKEKSDNADFINSLRSKGKEATLEKFSNNKSVLLSLETENAYKEIASKLKKDHTSARFISSTNYGAYKASARIKELITDQQTQLYENNLEIPNILKDDVLEISKNNYSKQVDLFNGDIVKVTSSIDFSDSKNYERIDVEIPLNDNNDLVDSIKNSKLSSDLKENYQEDEAKKIKENSAVFYKQSFTSNSWTTTPTLIKRTLLFCNIKLQHYGFETGKTNLTVKVLLNSINIPKVGNSKAMKLEEDILEQCIQQYVLEQFPTDGIEDDKIIKQLQEKIETHPYANAIWCSWGYAGTCHTSQGSEWEYVVADLNYAENFDSSWVYTALTRSQKTLCILNLENYKKSFVSDDLNLIDVDKVVIDHEVKSEKEQNSLQQFKEKIGSYFSSTNKETSELEEFNKIIDLIKLLPSPEPTDSEHYINKRKEHPRFGMPWTHEEEKLLLSLIKATLELSIFKDRTSSELIEYISEKFGRNSIGIKWLEFYSEGLVDMPSDLRDEWTVKANKFNDIEFLKEQEEINQKTPEEESEHRLKIKSAEKIVGTTLTTEQIQELQKLFKDSNKSDVELDQEVDDTFFEEDPYI